MLFFHVVDADHFRFEVFFDDVEALHLFRLPVIHSLHLLTERVLVQVELLDVSGQTLVEVGLRIGAAELADAEFIYRLLDQVLDQDFSRLDEREVTLVFRLLEAVFSQV